MLKFAMVECSDEQGGAVAVEGGGGGGDGVDAFKVDEGSAEGRGEDSWGLPLSEDSGPRGGPDFAIFFVAKSSPTRFRNVTITKTNTAMDLRFTCSNLMLRRKAMEAPHISPLTMLLRLKIFSPRTMHL